jgi:hypothetical protein
MYHLSYSSQVGQTLQKAKKRMKDQFNKFGFGKMKKKDGSVEETPGSCEFVSKINNFRTFQTSRQSFSASSFLCTLLFV